MVEAQFNWHQTDKNVSSNGSFPEFHKCNIFAKKELIVSLKKLKLTTVPPPPLSIHKDSEIIPPYGPDKLNFPSNGLQLRAFYNFTQFTEALLRFFRGHQQ